MKKGLITTLFATAITLAGISSFAVAPVITQLPDITIGDAEDEAVSQNNFFVFTNAFKFDDVVRDSDSTVSQLLWSFDEGDNAAPLTGATQWFTVNGFAPTHLGAAAMANDVTGGYAAHVSPANNLRAGHQYAEFRDIVFSPTSGSQPFPAPTGDAKTAHEAGKVVRFYVADDTQNVAYKDIIVKSVDNAYDRASYPNVFAVCQDDRFTSDPVPTVGNASGWSLFGETQFTSNNNAGWTTIGQPAGDISEAYDAASGSIRIHIGTVPVNTGAGMGAFGQRYRIGGYTANQTEWLPYATVISMPDAGSPGGVSTENYVRAKYYIYATGQNTSAKNEIPTFRIRVAQRYAVSSILEVQAHQNDDPANATYAQDLAPSTDANNPSIYRVDIAPVHNPYSAANPYTEGIARALDSFEQYPQGNGYLCLKESVIGAYPARMLADANAKASKLYRTSSTDAGDLKQFLPGDAPSVVNYILGTTLGAFAGGDLTGLATVNYGANGVTLDSTNVVSTKVGVATVNFNVDANANGSTAANNSARIRATANQVYKIRWHVTSTQNTNKNAALRLRARSIKFAWSQKLEIGGSWNTNGAQQNAIAQQILPGVGTQNPDQDSGDANKGGWYTEIMNSPISSDIGTQPALNALPGQGDPGTGGPANNPRDIFVGADLVDTLDGGTNATIEIGNFTIDKIDLRAFDQVVD